MTSAGVGVGSGVFPQIKHSPIGLILRASLHACPPGGSGRPCFSRFHPTCRLRATRRTLPHPHEICIPIESTYEPYTPQTLQPWTLNRGLLPLGRVAGGDAARVGRGALEGQGTPIHLILYSWGLGGARPFPAPPERRPAHRRGRGHECHHRRGHPQAPCMPLRVRGQGAGEAGRRGAPVPPQGMPHGQPWGYMGGMPDGQP